MMRQERTLESPLDCKEIKQVNPKGNQPWTFIGRTDAEAPILWPLDDEMSQLLGKKPWCWERLRARGEGGNRGWDGWVASLTQWTWVWASSRSWWWTGKPGVLQSMESQRFRHNWVTELTELLSHVCFFVTPWTAASQAPLSMWFSREEYWSGLPFPPPGHLPDPGIKP